MSKKIRIIHMGVLSTVERINKAAFYNAVPDVKKEYLLVFPEVIDIISEPDNCVVKIITKTGIYDITDLSVQYMSVLELLVIKHLKINKISYTLDVIIDTEYFKKLVQLNVFDNISIIYTNSNTTIRKIVESKRFEICFTRHEKDDDIVEFNFDEVIECVDGGWDFI